MAFSWGRCSVFHKRACGGCLCLRHNSGTGQKLGSHLLGGYRCGEGYHACHNHTVSKVFHIRMVYVNMIINVCSVSKCNYYANCMRKQHHK